MQYCNCWNCWSIYHHSSGHFSSMLLYFAHKVSFVHALATVDFMPCWCLCSELPHASLAVQDMNPGDVRIIYNRSFRRSGMYLYSGLCLTTNSLGVFVGNCHINLLKDQDRLSFKCFNQAGYLHRYFMQYHQKAVWLGQEFAIYQRWWWWWWWWWWLFSPTAAQQSCSLHRMAEKYPEAAAAFSIFRSDTGKWMSPFVNVCFPSKVSSKTNTRTGRRFE